MNIEEHNNVFIKIGGINALHDIVDRFYEKVLEDSSVNHFFEGADMNIQRGKMKAFLMMALGGPVKFTGKDIKQAHTKLVLNGLNDSHFDAIALHLDKSLEEYNVENSVRTEVHKVIESCRNDVLNRNL